MMMMMSLSPGTWAIGVGRIRGGLVLFAGAASPHRARRQRETAGGMRQEDEGPSKRAAKQGVGPDKKKQVPHILSSDKARGARVFHDRGEEGERMGPEGTRARGYRGQGDVSASRCFSGFFVHLQVNVVGASAVGSKERERQRERREEGVGVCSRVWLLYMRVARGRSQLGGPAGGREWEEAT